VYDGAASRFTVVSADGRLLRTIPTAQLRGIPVAVSRDRVLTLYSFRRFGPTERTDTIPAEYTLVDHRTGEVDTLGAFPGMMEQVILGITEFPARVRVPFDVMPSAAPARDGFFITPAEHPEIHEYGASGGLRRIIRLDEPPRHVTQPELDSIVELMSVRGARDSAAIPVLRSAFAKLPRAGIMAAFSALLVDDAGWLWAEINREDDQAPAQWLVFDPRGRARGTVAMPSGLEVRQISATWVLGVWHDSLRVEYVRRHSLKRGSPPARR
jgi:hypothetical protein